MRYRDSGSLPLHVREYVDSLVERLRPRAILLFGSVARGETHRTSDFDLLVVAEDLPFDFWERTDLLWVDKPFDVEVVGFRSQEIEDTIHRGFILDVLLTGKVLYGNLSDLQEKARRFVSERKLVRTRYGYFRKTSKV